MSSSRKKGQRRGQQQPKPTRKHRVPPDVMIHPDLDYQEALGEADRELVDNNVEVLRQNWQELVLNWFARAGRDRVEMARYVDANGDKLGPTWARDMLRLEVFFQAEDHDAIMVHYHQALAGYPRCALVELYVGERIGRHGAAWWRARAMLLYAAEHLPGYARPRYELGYHHYLLGDFPGALRWFDEAEARLTEEDAGFQASRLYFNRAIVRLMNTGDRDAAIVDLKQALQHDREYPQAQAHLRALKRGKVRWVPW